MATIPTSRADKLLASMGYGSRKDVARLARVGRITLDSAHLLDVTKRIPVTPDLPSRMQINGAALDPLPGMVILLNKPLGMTCSRKDPGPLVYDILPERWKRRDPAISTVGRLDKQTSGLLLLTDDGDLLHRSPEPCGLGLGGRGGGEVDHVLAQEPDLVAQVVDDLGGALGCFAHASPPFFTVGKRLRA